MKILKPYNQKLSRKEIINISEGENFNEDRQEIKLLDSISTNNSNSVNEKEIEEHIEDKDLLVSLVASWISKNKNFKKDNSSNGIGVIEYINSLSSKFIKNKSKRADFISKVIERIKLSDDDKSRIKIHIPIDEAKESIENRKLRLSNSLKNNQSPFYIKKLDEGFVLKPLNTKSKFFDYVLCSTPLKEIFSSENILEQGKVSLSFWENIDKVFDEYINHLLKIYEYDKFDFNINSIPKSHQIKNEEYGIKKFNDNPKNKRKKPQPILNIASLLKSSWNEHRRNSQDRIALAKSLEENADYNIDIEYSYIQNLLNEIFNSLFPIKGNRERNLQKLKILLSVSDKDDIDINKGKEYASILSEKIKSRIKLRFKNQLIQHFIRIGKVYKYRETLSIKTDDSEDYIFDSKSAIKISLYEEIVRNIIGMVSFANCSLKNAFNVNKVNSENDILLSFQSYEFNDNDNDKDNDKLNKRLEIILGDISEIRKCVIGNENSELEFNKHFLWYVAICLYRIRNNSYHFSGKELEKIFEKNSENIERTFKNKIKIPDHVENKSKEDYSKLKIKEIENLISSIIDKDEALVKERIESEIEANFIKDYFTKQEVEKLLKEFSIYTSVIPLKPSFSKVYKRMNNLGITRLEEKKLNDNTLYLAYRKMLQWYYDFKIWDKLEETYKSRDRFERLVEKVIEKGGSRSEKGKRNPYENFKEISISDKNIESYFAELQSYLATQFPSIGNDDKGSEYVSRFVQDILIELIEEERLGDGLLERLLSIKGDKVAEKEDLEINPKKLDSNEEFRNKYSYLYIILFFTDRNHVNDILQNINRYLAIKNQISESEDLEAVEYIKKILILQNYVGSYKIGNRTETIDKASDEYAQMNKFCSKEVLDKMINLQSKEGVQNVITYAPMRDMRKFAFTENILRIYPKSLKGDINKFNDYESFINIAPIKGSKIEDLQKKRENLHKILVRGGKSKNFNKAKEYLEVVKEIQRYNHLKHCLNFQYVKDLHTILIDLLSKMVESVNLWERDNFFILCGLAYYYSCLNVEDCELKNEKLLETVEKKIYKHNENGQRISISRQDKRNFNSVEKIIYPVSIYMHSEKSPYDRMPNGQIKGVNKINVDVEVFDKEVIKTNEDDYKLKNGCTIYKNVRNYIAHLNYLKYDNQKSSLIDCLNDLRDLMSYDKKLKNAVSKKFLGYLEREKFKVHLSLKGHEIDSNFINISSQQIEHLKEKGYRNLQYKSRKYHSHIYPIYAHDKEFVKAVKSLILNKNEGHNK